MGVDDGRESAVVAVADGQRQTGAAVALLAQPLIDQHVGVDRHTEHEHQAGKSGQGERGIHHDHEGHRQQKVGQQSDACDEAGEAVVDEHEPQHRHEGDDD